MLLEKSYELYGAGAMGVLGGGCSWVEIATQLQRQDHHVILAPQTIGAS